MMGNTLERAVKLDPAHLQTGSQLRALGRSELVRLGEDSLREHLVDTAIVAHELFFPLAGEQLQAFLENRNMVRHPVELVFEIGSMAGHQFAQPEPDGDGFRLSVHPALQKRGTDLAMAVAYFVPVMNYGSLINDDHCLIYGATLFGMTIEAYYAELCRIAGDIGVAPRMRDEQSDRF